MSDSIITAAWCIVGASVVITVAVTAYELWRAWSSRDTCPRCGAWCWVVWSKSRNRTCGQCNHWQRRALSFDGEVWVYGVWVDAQHPPRCTCALCTAYRGCM